MLAVGHREMRPDHKGTLGVGLVGPVAQRDLHAAPDLAFGRAVAGPGHYGLLQPPQEHVALEVLPVLLRYVDDVVAHPRDAGCPGKLFLAGRQAAPLGLEQVNYVQVLGLGLGVTALSGQEVDVGVAAVPPPGVHVDPAFDTERQLPLSPAR